MPVWPTGLLLALFVGPYMENWGQRLRHGWLFGAIVYQVDREVRV
jgi:hypothetical protein